MFSSDMKKTFHHHLKALSSRLFKFPLLLSPSVKNKLKIIIIMRGKCLVTGMGRGRSERPPEL